MPPPRGGGALLRNLSDKNGLSSAFQSGQNANENLTPQEQLLAGTLELDPENDPVICTTESGLEIKFHNAGEYQGEGYLLENPSTDGSVSLGDGNNYAYITMGSYGGADVHWVIIGYSTNAATGINVVKATGVGIPDETDAGNELNLASSNGALVSIQYLLNAYTNAVPSDEITGGCVLVISQSRLYKAQFHASSSIYYTSSTTYSNLRQEMLNLYDNDLGFTKSQKDKIIAQDLTTAQSANVTDKIFPLGSSRRSGDSFPVETYLNSTDKRKAGEWWLRSLYNLNDKYICLVHKYGSISGYGCTYELGVRPAFVLKI